MESSKIAFALISLTAVALLHYVHAQDSPQEYLDAHNAARAEVGVEPLEWDDEAAGFAENYANTLTSDCRLVHSNVMKYGEDLAMSTGDMSAVEAVNLWVGEKSDYDYNSNSCLDKNKMCGHYTQVVWRNTLRVGCGKARCGSGGTIIGCNYDPPGNWIGEKPY